MSKIFVFQSLEETEVVDSWEEAADSGVSLFIQCHTKYSTDGTLISESHTESHTEQHSS